MTWTKEQKQTAVREYLLILEKRPWLSRFDALQVISKMYPHTYQVRLFFCVVFSAVFIVVFCLVLFLVESSLYLFITVY